jgi:hypothetical protein
MVNVMNEQKIITAFVDPTDGSKAMQQIQAAAGEGTWRILSIVAFPEGAAAKRSSPGINDPRLRQGEPVLVVLEQTPDVPLRRAHRLAATEAV